MMISILILLIIVTLLAYRAGWADAKRFYKNNSKELKKVSLLLGE